MKTTHLWFTLFTAVVITCTFGQSAQGQETGKSLKWKVAIGRFSNETQYGKGIFYGSSEILCDDLIVEREKS